MGRAFKHPISLIKLKFVALIKYEDQRYHRIDELGWDEDGYFKWVRIGDRLIVPDRLEIFQYLSTDKDGQEIYKNIVDDTVIIPYPLLHVGV